MSGGRETETDTGGGHVPVLLAEVLQAMTPGEGELFIDGTFGGGGYARAFLAAGCQVVGIDRDPSAIARGRTLEAASRGRLRLILGEFARMDALVEEPVDGVALDLGVASPQLDDPGRGFSFRADGPLDMRMARSGPTAADAVNALSEQQLVSVLAEFGEERHARRVARAIVAARREAPIERTLHLAEIVRRAVPPSRDGLDPATRCFQGLRIYVNDELGQLDRGLQAAERVLRPGGRLAVVCFHSLEDRRVKRFLAERSGADRATSRHRPPPAARPAPTFRPLWRRPVTPSPAEVASNPRARSARLRAATRTDAPPWPTPAGTQRMAS